MPTSTGRFTRTPTAWFALPFDELVPGMTVTTPGRTITEADIVLFGGITGQLHPVHTDARFAAATPAGQRTPQGLLLVSYALGLLPMHDSPAIVLRQFREITFKRPGHIGMTIHSDATVAGLRPVDERTGLVEVRLELRDEDELLIARGGASILWGRAAPH